MFYIFFSVFYSICFKTCCERWSFSFFFLNWIEPKSAFAHSIVFWNMFHALLNIIFFNIKKSNFNVNLFCCTFSCLCSSIWHLCHIKCNNTNNNNKIIIGFVFFFFWLPGWFIPCLFYKKKKWGNENFIWLLLRTNNILKMRE